MTQIPVIDLFAGPGGLNEGFSRYAPAGGHRAFRVAASFEMDAIACRTLTTRSAVRALVGGDEDRKYRAFLKGELDWVDWTRRPAVAAALESASEEVHQVELGPSTRTATIASIEASLGTVAAKGVWVLIGGPPCQAYSLVGRSRRTHDVTFADDVKHYLYREYLHIIETLRPPVFVMENVKGLLSHRLAGVSIFDQILDDLRRPGYEVRSLVVPGESPEPRDFVIKAEEHGVPQRRHRVILLGVRSDLVGAPSATLKPETAPSVMDVIGHLPRLRSRISPIRSDDARVWRELRDAALRMAGASRGGSVPATAGATHGVGMLKGSSRGIEGWLTGGRPSHVIQHEARSHMPADLQRYAYFAAMAQGDKIIKVSDLPPRLRPFHKNVDRKDVPFSDRFRVQVGERPSTTVVSHIAKDGHYYIHYDPDQMRSLSVREAARLQTFPDDYFFSGNRTQQYHQVGNAVPPLLAHQLAEIVHTLLTS